MSDEHTPKARYTLRISADSGYKSTAEGECTPHQYSMAIAALNGAPHTSQELQAERDTLLATLQLIAQTRPVHGLNPNARMSDPNNVKVGWNVHWIAQAALAKVEGLDVVGEPT